MSDADRTPDEATLAHHRACTGGPPESPVKRVTIHITGLRGGARIEREQPCVDCGKAVRVAARIDGNRAAMPEALCAGCAPFRRLAEDLASVTGQSREAMHRLLSVLAKSAPVIDTTAARARIAHMAIGGAYPACPDRKDEHG